jgi:hypothetical protein
MSGRHGIARFALALVLGLALALARAAPPGAARGIVGKPTGPIAIQHALAEPPALGRALEVSITVTSAVALDNVTLALAADEGLAFNTAVTALRIARIGAGETYATTISVTPLVLDVLEIAVTVEGDTAGARQAATALLPIRLVARKSRGPTALKVDPASRGVVHSLPGRERPSDRLLP